MYLLTFRFWTATVLIFSKNGLKALKTMPKYGKTETQSWPLGSVKNNNI